MALRQTTLIILRIQLLRYQLGMDLTNFEALRASSVFERLSKETQDFLNRMISTIEGAAQSPMPLVGDPLEIPKSPRMPRPKKDPQAVGPVRMSPRNRSLVNCLWKTRARLLILRQMRRRRTSNLS